MANIVISFYAPKQTAFLRFFVERAVENDRLFLLSVKRRRLSRKSGGVGGESGQLFASGGGGDCVGRVVPARALRALSEFSFFCLHRVLFRFQSIDSKWFMREDITS